MLADRFWLPWKWRHCNCDACFGLFLQAGASCSSASSIPLTALSDQCEINPLQIHPHALSKSKGGAVAGFFLCPLLISHLSTKCKIQSLPMLQLIWSRKPWEKREWSGCREDCRSCLALTKDLFSTSPLVVALCWLVGELKVLLLVQCSRKRWDWVRTSQTGNTAPCLSSLWAAGGAVSPERRSNPVHNGSSCPVNRDRPSQGGQDAGEGDDDREGGLAHAKHQGLQWRHVLPSHSVHTRHRRAYEGAEKEDKDIHSC